LGQNKEGVIGSPRTSEGFFPGPLPTPPENFYQNPFFTSGEIMFTRNDYIHADRQHTHTHTQQQYIISRAPAEIAADKDNIIYAKQRPL